MIILRILGYILLTLVAIAVLLLVVPFRFEMEAQKDETVAYAKAKVSWMFISFNIMKAQALVVYINILGLKKYVDFKALNKKREKVEKLEQDNAGSYLDREFLSFAFECVKKILRHIKPRRFLIEGTVGFDDPYITGIMCGLINILKDVPLGADIRVNTVFDDEIFEGKCFIQGRIVVAYIAYIGLRLYLSRPDKINNKPIKLKEANSNE